MVWPLAQWAREKYRLVVGEMDNVMSTMKYAKVDFGFAEAVLNKLGGVEGAERLLRDELMLVNALPAAKSGKRKGGEKLTLDVLEPVLNRVQSLLADKQDGHASWHMALNEGLLELKQLLGKAFPSVPSEPNILTIDRSTPFDPKFIGDGWTIEEQDERSLALTEIDVTKIELETTLKRGESSVKGEKKLKRLKDDGRIRLDAKVFLTFWEDQSKIPEDWKKPDANGNIRYICFDGTVLRYPNGRRDVLCLCWDDGGWYWDVGWLDREFLVLGPSALLAN